MPGEAKVPEVARELGGQRGHLPPLEKAVEGGTSPQEAKRLKELGKENARLKTLLAEKELDIDLPKEVSRAYCLQDLEAALAQEATRTVVDGSRAFYPEAQYRSPNPVP